MIRKIISPSLLSILALATATAAPGDLDSPFMTTVANGFSKPTNAVAIQADGKILVGGTSGQFQGGATSAMWRLTAAGALDTVVSSFATNTGVPEIKGIVVQNDGKILVGGTFDSFGAHARSGILRLNSDTSIDTGFAPAGLSGTLRSAQDIAVQTDNKILIGGGFTAINGTGRPGIARLNPDGTLDATFNPTLPFSYYSIGVDDVEIQADGKILAGGSYSATISGGGGPFIVRFNSDGSADPSFNGAIASSSTFGIQQVAIQADGRILISGAWNAGGGLTYWIRRLMPNGAPDNSFALTTSNGWLGGDIQILPDGKILASGVFNNYGGHSTASIVRLFPDGSVDTSFAPVPHTTERGQYGTHAYSIAQQADGKFVCVGWMNNDDGIASGSPTANPGIRINGTPIYNITRFEGDYAVGPGKITLSSTTFEGAEGTTLTITAARYGGSSGAVGASYSVSGGSATSGTDYTATPGTLNWANGETGVKTFTITLAADSVNEGTETANITLSSPTGGAILSPNSSATLRILDANSAPTITLDPLTQTVTATRQLVLSVTAESGLTFTYQWKKGGADLPGMTGSVLVINNLGLSDAGAYTVTVTNSIGSTPSATATITVILPPGYPDPAFAFPGGSGFSPITNVRGITRLANGGFLVRSWNTTYGGVPFTYMARLTSTFALDTTFNTNLGSGPNTGSLEAAIEAPDGKLYVVGSMTSFSGHTTATVARLHPNGSVDTSFSASLGAVAAGYTAALDSQGRLMVGKYTALVRLTATGAVDPSFSFGPASGLIAGWKAYRIIPLPDGKLIVTGSNGGTIDFIYRLNPDGSQDTSFLGGSRFVRSNNNNGAPVIDMLEVFPDGRVLLAGQFNSIDGISDPAISSNYRKLVMLAADGSIDPSIPNTAIFYGGSIRSSILLPNGQIVISGDFTNYRNESVNKVVRMNPDGTLDSTFIVQAATPSTYAMALAPDGGIFTPSGVLLNDLAGVIRITNTSATTVENNGPITVTVERVFGKSGTAGVSYATSGITAISGTDFTAASGTLSWANGEFGPKTVIVSITPDTTPEADETFQFALSAPTGTGVTLAPPSSWIVTILDDDSLPVFTTQPTGGSVNEGFPITLSTVVYSTPAVSYQWFKGLTLLAGKTNPTLPFTTATPADAGDYRLRATNVNGETFSNTVTLNVVPEPAYRDPAFAFTTTLNSSITDIASLPAGGAIVGGNFTTVPGLTSGRYLFKVGENGVIDSAYNPAPNSSVSALALQPDGKLIVAGNFTQIAGSTATYLARLNSDGTQDTAFTTNLGTGPNSTIASIAVLPNGKIAIGGNFTAVNNHYSGYIAVLNANGSVDTSFLSVATNQAFCVAAQADGKILSSGSFNYGSAIRFARILPTGAQDTTFDSSISQSNTIIRKILPLSDGRIALGGSSMLSSRSFAILSANGTFETQLSTTSQFEDIAEQKNGKLVGVGSAGIRTDRWSAAGVLDSAFRTALGSGFNSTCNAVALNTFGKIWIGGSFASFNGVSVNQLVLLNGDKVNIAILNQPAASISNPGTTVSFSINATSQTAITYQWLKNGIAISNGGNISGATSANLQIANAAKSDEGQYSVVITNASGSITSAAVPLNVLGSPEIVSQSPNIDAFTGDTVTLKNTILALAPVTYSWSKNNGPTLIDGGNLTGATTSNLQLSSIIAADAGQYILTATNNLGSISTTAITLTVTPPPAGIAPAFAALSTSSWVNAILTLPDGRALVSINNSSILTGSNGADPANRLHLVNANGTVSSTQPFGIVNNTVSYMARQPDGKIILTGLFTTIGGVSRVGVARLNANLTLDTSFNAALATAPTTNSLAIDSSGRAHIGGTFANWNGDTRGAYLARLNPDGSLDTSFNAGLNQNVFALEFQADGKLLAGGQFTLPATYVVRLEDNGTRDTTFTASSWGSIVYAITTDTSGRIYLGGPSPYVRRFSSTGLWDQGFVLDPVPNTNLVQHLKIQRDGKLLIGGSFRNTSNSAVPSGIMRVDDTGKTDPRFNPGVGTTTNTAIYSMALAGDGKIWLGGTFNSYAGLARNYIAVLNGDAVPLAITAGPTPQEVEPGQTATFSAYATGTSTLSYQWKKNNTPLTDGGNISGATTGTLLIANADATAVAAYTVTVTNLSGNQTSAAANLILLGAPEILSAPIAVTQEAGLAASFTVTARGIASLTYQWYRGNTPLTNGSNVTGATSNKLNLTNLTVSDTGSIKVTITNSQGNTTSIPVALSVVKPPAGFVRGFPMPGFNSSIYALSPADDGSFLAGGNFSTVTWTSGSASRNRFAKIKTDGTADLNFPTVNNLVYAIQRDSLGRIYLGGSFTSVTQAVGGTVTRNRILRLLPSGAIDTSFDPLVTPNSNVKRIAIDANNKVLIAGDFSNVNSVAGTAYIARLNENGSVDTTFVSQANYFVGDIAIRPDGKIWAAHPNSYSGQSYIVRLESNGTRDTSFTYSGNMTCYDLAPLPDGGVLSCSTSWPYVQKIGATGTINTTFPATSGQQGASGQVQSVAADAAGGFILSGSFTTYGGQAANNLVRILADGSRDPNFDSGSGFAGSYAETIRIDSTGRIWLGGFFTTYRAESALYATVLNGSGVTSADPFTAWATTNNLPAGFADLGDDPDSDGIPNAIEFLYGGNPTQAGPLPVAVNPTNTTGTGAAINAIASAGLDPAKTYRIATFRIPKNTNGLVAQVQASLDLTSMGNGSAQATVFGTPVDDGLYELRNYYLTPAASDQPIMWWRLKVNKP